MPQNVPGDCRLNFRFDVRMIGNSALTLNAQRTTPNAFADVAQLAEQLIRNQ
jgi:hypothetical protein